MSPATGAATEISVERLTVEYGSGSGRVLALNDLSFSICRGSSVAIVGPSGCGKSTLLSMLGGLAVPTRGAVRVGPIDMGTLTDSQRATFRRSHLGFVYQADNLLPFLTVAENVVLRLAMAGDPNGARDRTMAILAALGLEDKADDLPDTLSGGQRQRVAVARAVVHRPAVILADEPTGALDSGNADAVIELLLNARGEIDSTLVMVTHDADAAGRMSRKIMLRDGAVIDDSGAGDAG